MGSNMTPAQRVQLFGLLVAFLVVVAIPFAADHEDLEWWVPIFFGLFFYVVMLWTTRCPGCGRFFTLKSAPGEGPRALSVLRPNLRQQCEFCGHSRTRPNRGGGA